jgi:hypothetical protein
MPEVITKLDQSQKRRISLKPEVVDKLERCIGSYFGRSVASSIWCLGRSSCQFAVDPTLRNTLLEDHSMQFVDVFVNSCFLRLVCWSYDSSVVYRRGLVLCHDRIDRT